MSIPRQERGQGNSDELARIRGLNKLDHMQIENGTRSSGHPEQSPASNVYTTYHACQGTLPAKRTKAMHPIALHIFTQTNIHLAQLMH